MDRKDILHAVSYWQETKRFLQKYQSKVAKRKTGHLRPIQNILDEMMELKIMKKVESDPVKRSKIHHKILKLEKEVSSWRV
jgi:hypothetical protein